MFDYITALYYGESAEVYTPTRLEKPATFEERDLAAQLSQVKAELGEDFYHKLNCSLRVVLEGCQVNAFRAGFQTGGQIALSILGEAQ